MPLILFSTDDTAWPYLFTIHTRRILFAMLAPGLCIALAYIYSHELYNYAISVYGSLPYLPYVVMIAGMLLTWGYNNGREFNVLLFLATGYWVIRQYIWEASLPVEQTSLLYAVLCVIIPLGMMLHHLLPERGIWRWQLAKRVTLTMLLCGSIALVFIYPQTQVIALLRSALWHNPWPKLVTITQPGIILFSIAALTLIIQLMMKANVLRSGMLMSLIAVGLAMNTIAQPSMAMVYFSIAACAIVLGIVLNSYNLAYLDELTELPTRRALKQHLLALNKRYSIVMLDLDHFKKLNDRYGHNVGDQVLRMVAAQLQRVSGGGKAYRFGGEEFTIVFNNKDAREVIEHIDAVRKRIEQNPFFIRSRKRPRTKPDQPVKNGKLRKVKVTISAGIAEYNERHANAQDVIKSADKALYTAKRAGRNRVYAI